MADVADNLVLESLSSLIGNGDIDSVNIDFKVDKSFLVNGNDMRNGTGLTIDASQIPFDKTAEADTTESESIKHWFKNIALLRTTNENEIQTVDCKNVKFTSEVTEVNGAGFTINYPNAPIELTSTQFNITSTGFDIENSGKLEITNENGINIENKNGGFLLSNTGNFTINNTAVGDKGGIYLNTTGGKPVSITSGQFKHTFRSPDSSYTRYFASDGNLTVVSSNDPTRDPYYVTKAQLITYDENYIVSPTIPKTFGNDDGFIQQGILFSGNTGNAYAAIHHYFGASSSSDADSDIRKAQSSINFQLTVPFKKIYDVDENGKVKQDESKKDIKFVKNWHGSNEPWTSNSNHIGAQLGIKYHPTGFKGTALEPDSNEPIGISTYCNIWPDDDYNSGNQIATSGWANGRFELKEFRDEPGKFIDYYRTTTWREDSNYRPLIYCKTQHTLTFKDGKTETVYAGYRGYRLSKVHSPIGISSLTFSESDVADWTEYTEKGYYHPSYETVVYTSATVENDTAVNRVLWANCEQYNRDYPRAGNVYKQYGNLNPLQYGYGQSSIFLCEAFTNFEKILIVADTDNGNCMHTYILDTRDLNAELNGEYFNMAFGNEYHVTTILKGLNDHYWCVGSYKGTNANHDWNSTTTRFLTYSSSDWENSRIYMIAGINRLPGKKSKTLINDDIPSYA